MSTATDIDIELLVGEMEALECGHSQHGAHPNHDEGPATHYAQGKCSHCGKATDVYPACAAFVTSVITGYPAHCQTCLSKSCAVTILGPVGGRK